MLKQLLPNAIRLAAASLLCVFLVPARADELGDAAARLFKQYSPVLRAVRIGLETEDGKRAEFTLPGVIVSRSGLTLVSVPATLLTYPRSYFKRFELLRPGRMDGPIDARLVALNELIEVAFVEPLKPADHPFLDFSDTGPVPPLGAPLIALGMLGRTDGYRCSYELARTGPPLGPEPFAVSDLRTDAQGLLFFTPDGHLVGLGRAAGDGESLSPRGERGSSNFMDQPRAIRATVLTSAVDYAVKNRRDRPDPWMGVAGLSVAGRDICEAYGLPADTVAILVGAVVDGFPAANAELKPKDFIIEFNGKPIDRGATDDETLEMWTRRLKRLDVGQDIELTLWRDQKRLAVHMSLVEAPIAPARASREFSQPLGLSVRDIVFRDRFERRLDSAQQGVVVAHLVQSGPADTAELSEGDIIRKVDETTVRNVETYRKVLKKKLTAKPSELVFSVLRGTSEQLIIRVELQPAHGEPPASRKD